MGLSIPSPVCRSAVRIVNRDLETLMFFCCTECSHDPCSWPYRSSSLPHTSDWRHSSPEGTDLSICRPLPYQNLLLTGIENLKHKTVCSHNPSEAFQKGVGIPQSYLLSLLVTQPQIHFYMWPHLSGVGLTDTSHY